MKNVILIVILVAGCSSVDNVEMEDGFSEAGVNDERQDSGSDSRGNSPSKDGQDDGAELRDTGTVQDSSPQLPDARNSSAHDAEVRDSQEAPIIFEPSQDRFNGQLICWKIDEQTGHRSGLARDGERCDDNFEAMNHTERFGRCWKGLCCRKGCWDGQKCVEETPDWTGEYKWFGRACGEVR